MKLIKKISVGLVAGTFIFSAALAQDGTTATSTDSGETTKLNEVISQLRDKTADSGTTGRFSSRVMKNYDKDGDGTLSETEKQTAIDDGVSRLKQAIEKNSELKEKLATKFDTDKDGVLSDTELKTAVENRIANAKTGGGSGNRMMMKFDTDGDGVISDTEKQAAIDQGVTRLKSEIEKNADLKSKLITSFDADKDGALSDTELKTAIGSRASERRGGGGGRERFNPDTNGDGTISDEEKSAAVTQGVTRLKSDLERTQTLKPGWWLILMPIKTALSATPNSRRPWNRRCRKNVAVAADASIRTPTATEPFPMKKRRPPGRRA